MSEKFTAIAALRPEDRSDAQRKAAAVAALELIAAAVANPNNKAALQEEVSRLAEYTDAIQAVMKPK